MMINMKIGQVSISHRARKWDCERAIFNFKINYCSNAFQSNCKLKFKKSPRGSHFYWLEEWMQKITNKKPPNQACSLIGRVGPHLGRSPHSASIFPSATGAFFTQGEKKTASCSQWAPKQIHLYFKCKIRLQRISSPSNFYATWIFADRNVMNIK